MKLNRLGYLLLVVFLVAIIGLTFVACQEDPTPEPQTGDEAGAYYYDAGSDEYTVVLGEGLQFTLNIAGTTMAGNYLLNDGALVLTSNKQDDNQISASLRDNVITLTFNGAEYRFLKKVNFTVTFNSNGGSAVNSATVVNGKKVAQPAEPNKDGHIFVGWYSDASFSAPFSFNSIITANTTVYARWVEKQVGALEFTVSFDADNGGANPEPKSTVSGGKLFNLPVVEKEGHTFNGWWVSMNGDDTLSYEYKEGMALDADTTLHAVWQASNLGSKLADPLVNVDATTIKWNNVGAREYLLQVKDAEGNFIVDKTIGGTAESVNFANYPAGDYTVTVTAVAASGEQNNSVCTRVYKNKAIARVSKFNVIEPATLLFNAVENAEKYLIKVSCGDENHNHNKEDVYFDNGTFTHFSFADCMMGNSGIKFTVIAVANGFATSASAEFTYAPTLDAITDFKFDEQTQTLVWTPVANATGYMVSVKSGNGALSEQFVNVGAANSICLKECSNAQGGIVVKVYPVSQMYISPEAASYTFNKQNLATPQNIRIQGTTVSWSAVEGATSYEVRIAGATIPATTNSVDLAGKVALTERESYTLVVVANGAAASLPTDPVDARNLAMADIMKYSNGMLSWAHVIGAEKYEVQVNDDAVITVSNGLNYTGVNLSQAGENTLKVRFVDENGTTFEWVSMKVFAHTVTFVSDGGSSVSEQYKAVGDSIELPKPQKDGYEFLNWYQTPKGPETNGAAFMDTVFKASGDLVLYACYTSKAYTVNYHYGNGGNGVEVSDVAYYQQNYTWIVPQANDATSAFGGWFSAPNGNGVQYTDDNGVSLNPWTKLENADVYALWYDDVLSFTLTNNGGRQIYAVMQGSRIDLVSEVTVPETYKGIKVGMLSGNAFKGCSNLVTINIPNTIEIISDVDPFTGCSSLTAINVYEVEGNNSIRYWSADGVLFDNGRLDQQPSDPSQIKAAISYMPLGKTGSYTIPNGIVEIPSLAFANSALTRVVIPASVATIGMEAFKDCKNLTTVVFDSGSKTPLTIGDSAFSGCKALETITLPVRLASIELTKYTLENATGTPATQQVSTEIGVTNAFVGCTNLKNIFIASGNTAYKSKDGIIYNANGTQLLYALPSVRGDVVIPDDVTTIANGAFIGCGYIESVTIPNTVIMVGECAFYNTDIEGLNFKGLTIGNTDVTIGKYAFRGCNDLESVTFEEGNRIAIIGEGAFYGCSYLESISLPANLKSVGVQAFRDCEYLEEVLFHKNNNNEVTFGSDAFYNCESLETIELPKNVKELPSVFSGCTSLEEVIVHEDNQYFTSEDGVLFDKAKTTILFYPQSKYDSEFVTPETLTTISDGVFKGNTSLESITIGKNVTYIGANAFAGCRYVEEVIFEEGGTASLEIGAYAFYDMSYLKSIELPERTKKVGEYAFSSSSYSGSAISSITLNEGLEEISDGMLYNARNLTRITIPSTVTKIGKWAFYDGGYEDEVFYVTFAEGSKLEIIDDDAFYYCGRYANASDGLTITLPQGLKHIGREAFYYTGFVSVTIPNTVETIGMDAFATSNKLSEVIFEEGGDKDLIFVEGWNNSAYYNGAFRGVRLESIALPERLTFLGASAFKDCNKLTSVSFGNNSRLKYIGASAFESSGIEEITIPNTVANGTYVIDANGTQQFRIGIGANAFKWASNLTAITFAQGGTAPLSIGNGAFYNYEDLETVNLPARLSDYTDENGNVVRGISAWSFISDSQGQASSGSLSEINVEQGGTYYCSVDGILYTADKKTLILCPVAKTGKVTIPAEVTLIDHVAFASTNVEEIEFVGGNDDMVIGERAFYRCNSITEVVLSDNVIELKEDAFGRCSGLTSITLSARMKTYNPNAFTGTTLQINISPNSSDLSSVGGVVFNKDKTVLISYPVKAEAEAFTVPATVKEISANAFENNQSLKSVTLPAGLVTIGTYAFGGCSQLTSVTIPNTVETIGNRAFYGCGLSEVKFEKGGSAQLVIETYAFQASGITTVELPARLISLGTYAFYDCRSLRTLTFASGSKLDSIGDNAFYNCSSLQSVELPQGLSQIGSRVFASCSSLVSVTFGEGLTKIGDYVFTRCAKLESVSFPASLKTMGIGTFADSTSYSSVPCAALTSVSFAPGSQLEAIPESTFYKCTSLERITIPASVKVIESPLWDDDYYRPESGHFGAFQECTSLKSVTFEEGSKCVEIGNMAFYKCIGLEAFAIPSSVSKLGDVAFQYSGLVEIVIPTTTTSYGRSLFANCTSLTKVTLNEKATALSNGMFAYCENLKQLNIPASVTSFGSGLLQGTGIESFVVPANVTELPASFLSSCKKLTSVTLHDGITVIGSSAFQSCTALESIDLPSNLKTIGDYAFSDCKALREVVVPANVTFIGYEAFGYCSALSEVTLSQNLETIDRYAFRDCTTLISITIPAKVKTIEYGAFYNCGKLFEVVNLSSLNINKNHNSYIGYYAIAILSADDEKMIKSTEDGFKYIQDGSNAQVIAYVGTSTQVTIPSNITAIAAYAFQNCDFVSVTLPANLTSIGSYAFANSANLTTVTIQGELTEIGEKAFYQCGKLTSVNLPDSITAIDKSAFEGCKSLQNVTLPASLTSLGSYAFEYCESIDSIVIPDGITSLNSYVFGYCKSLETVTLPASLASFNASAFTGCEALAEFAMENDGNDNFKIYESVLYTYTENGGQINWTLNCVPTAMKGTLKLPQGLTSVPNTSSNNLNVYTSITSFEMEGCESGVSFKAVNDNGTYKLIQVASDNTETEIKSGSYRVIDGALYQISIVTNEYYRKNSSDKCTVATVSYKLISVPAGKTGTFIVPKFVTGNNISQYAFVNCHLDLLKFESHVEPTYVTDENGEALYKSANTESDSDKATFDGRLDLSYYSSGNWLNISNSIKEIVLTMDDFTEVDNWFVKSWTSDQTVRFTDTKEVADEKIKGGAIVTNAKVIYADSAE